VVLLPFEISVPSKGNYLNENDSRGYFVAADQQLANLLFGQQNRNLKLMERTLGIRIGSKGNEVRIEGDPPQVDLAKRLLQELYSLLQEGYPLYPTDIDYASRILSADSSARLKNIFLDTIYVSARNKIIAPKSLAQKSYIDAIRSNDLVFGIGPAGTGKTYLAMAMAVATLMKKEVSRIVLVRPAVEAGEKLGFLPGDLAEKVNPYLRPLYDALYDMMDFEKGQALVEKGVVEVAPLAFMRGRTLNDAFVILDEAQNTTAEQMKMFLTRLGFGSRAVVTGDVTQIDLPTGRISGLTEAARVLKDVEGIQFCHFSDRDVVRHPIVQLIVQAYDRARQGAETAPGGADEEPTPDVQS
jgi:phosphate starvation-inducible PhoH-like protein